MKAIGSHQLLVEEGDTAESIAAACVSQASRASDLEACNPGTKVEPGAHLAIPPGWQPVASQRLELFDEAKHTHPNAAGNASTEPPT